MRKKKQRTYIGGQAVIQGVMMRSKSGMATCVRDDNGVMQLEAKRITPPEKQKKWKRFPFIRGVVNFVSSLVLGMKALMRSSEVAITEEEEQPSKLSKWIADHWKISVGEILSVISCEKQRCHRDAERGEGPVVRRFERGFRTAQRIAQRLDAGVVLEGQRDAAVFGRERNFADRLVAGFPDHLAVGEQLRRLEKRFFYRLKSGLRVKPARTETDVHFGESPAFQLPGIEVA